MAAEVENGNVKIGKEKARYCLCLNEAGYTGGWAGAVWVRAAGYETR